jgi:hypothetical protein
MRAAPGAWEAIIMERGSPPREAIEGVNIMCIRRELNKELEEELKI